MRTGTCRGGSSGCRGWSTRRPLRRSGHPTPPRPAHSAPSSSPLLRKKSAPLRRGAFRSVSTSRPICRDVTHTGPGQRGLLTRNRHSCVTVWGQTPEAHVGRAKVCRLTRSDCALAARGAAGLTGSRRRDSNPRPTVYKTVALPTELLRRTLIVSEVLVVGFGHGPADWLGKLIVWSIRRTSATVPR
jgi:hypothetical protein